MKTYNKMDFLEQCQAQAIICNIVTMQKIIYGKSFEFSDFIDNTIDELRNLQNMLLCEYNEAVKNK
jgi:hypothetical protein